MYKVYVTRICLYCDKAENLLKTKDLPFEKNDIWLTPPCEKEK